MNDMTLFIVGFFVAGVAIAPAVSVVAHDAFGNTVPGVSIALSMTGTGTLTGGAPVTTDSTGTANFAALSVERSGGKTLTALHGQITATSSTFSVSPAAASSLAFMTQPSDVLAGVPVAPEVAVMAQDVFGNGVPGQAITLALDGTGTLTGGATTLTDALGTATFGAVSIDLVGRKTLTASSDLLTATSHTFTVSPAAAASLTFTTQPSAVVAGEPILPAVQVIGHDAFGNVTPGLAVALSLDGTGVLSGGEAILSDSTGVATFPTLTTTLAGNKSLTARAGALATTSTSFVVTAASPAALAYLTPPSDVIAGVAITPAVRVAVTDVFGNVVPGGAITVSAPDGSGISGHGTVASDSTGIATFADLVLTRAGRHTLLAENGLHSARSDSFTVSAAAPATLAFVTPPSTSVAGLVIAPTVTLAVQDAFANPVPSTPVGVALEGAGTLLGDTVSVTDAEGLAAFPTLAVDRTGTHMLRASIDTLTSVSPAFTITPGVPATLTFLTAPSDVIAGDLVSPAVQVVVHDAFGNAVPGANVSLAAPSLAGGDAVATDDLGTASFPALSLTLAGSRTITATSGDASHTSPSFTVSPAAAASLAFVVPPSDVVAGDAMAPAVQVLVQDRFGNVAPGRAVSLAVEGTGTLLGGASELTDAQGRASFAGLTLDRMGRKSLTASHDSLRVTSEMFTVAPAAADSLAFAATPADAVAGTTLTPTVEVRVHDRFGNPAIGSIVQLALTTTGTLSGVTSANVDSVGLATFPALSIEHAGTHTLAATSGSLQATSASFSIVAATADHLTFVTEPSDAVAGIALAPAVTVLVEDRFGNAVAGHAVALTLDTDTLTVAQDTLTDATGLATFADVRVGTMGTHTLRTRAGSLAVVASRTFVISAAPAASLAFVVAPTNTVAGSTMAPAAYPTAVGCPG